jgi:trimeric autotransporter adhesin
MKRLSAFCVLSLLLTIMFALSAFAQITPSDDSYTLTSTPTINFGAKNTLEVESAGATTFVRFDLSGIPPTVTGAMVAKATLKIYVSTVTTAGSFNVDLVTSPWTESTITANNTPTLGSAIVSAVPVTTADKNKYVLVDVTAAAVGWLNGTANDGIAIVPDGAVSFALNSKETTTTSHPAELDIVLTGPAGPPGPISGVTAGAGLTGGGTKGNVTLSLLTTCSSGQVLQWSGSTWVCATTKGSGTITGVTAGTDLTGGGTSGKVTLNLDTTKIPQLTSNNVFSGSQTISGNAGIGAAASTNTYTPLTVGSANGFGTWFAITNSSSGGHTWNIISAGGGNAEGAGNLGITDLTGKSTIWLEGNTNTGNLTATTSAGGAIIDADVFGKNSGAFTPGLRFGGAASGEGIISNRVGGGNAFGLQLFTEFTPRLSILQNGQVGIGINNPSYQLEVLSSSSAYDAIFGQGGAASNGSGGNGSIGVHGFGGNGDLTSGSNYGGPGIFGEGGIGNNVDGDGGVFFGGNQSSYGDGIFAASGSANSWAGFFQGNVGITGIVSGGVMSFTIDHPLDPSNKYLSHSSVESPDMMDLYNGNVVTDANGDAVVPLPEWFETLNRDFRYQLTVVGQFAQAIVASKVANNRFSIKTDKPSVEVSWQVTGIRQDAWANAHRIPVEEEKDARERGHYLRPELYGAPEEAGIEWARHPDMMKHMKQIRQQGSSPHAPAVEKSGPTASPATR